MQQKAALLAGGAPWRLLAAGSFPAWAIINQQLQKAKNDMASSAKEWKTPDDRTAAGSGRPDAKLL